SDAAMMKARFLQSGGCDGEIFATQENIHVASVADGGFIGARNPRGHRITADHCVRYVRFGESRRGAQKAAADVFDGVAHALPGDRAERGGRMRKSALNPLEKRSIIGWPSRP